MSARSVTVTPVIVTSCTQRKSGYGAIDFGQLPDVRQLVRLAEAWQRVVARALRRMPAKSLYQGRSIADTSAAAQYLGARWYVISAGLGLLHSDQAVPAYDCTVAPGSELGDRLKLLGATSADWWNAITARRPHPLSRLVAQSPILLALPSSYLRMVHDDLARIRPAKAVQLRIFTSTAGVQFVPRHLVTCVMPYDNRLESVRKYAGTQADFAQRALRHFVEALDGGALPLEEARAKVSAALAHRRRRLRTMGTRMSDEQIRRVLIRQWNRHQGSSTRLLRYLRDEAHISCEQKRFAGIWQALAAQLQA